MPILDAVSVINGRVLIQDPPSLNKEDDMRSNLFPQKMKQCHILGIRKRAVIDFNAVAKQQTKFSDFLSKYYRCHLPP